MAAPKKPAALRQDNRAERGAAAKGAQLVRPDIPGVTGVVAPEPGEGWLPEVAQQWSEFWASDVARAVERSDRPAIFRLFEMRDLQARCWARHQEMPYIDGSQGQPVANPAFAEAMTLEKAILALEDRLALNPKARVALGLAVGQAQITAAQLNAMSEERRDDDDDALLAEWSEEAAGD